MDILIRLRDNIYFMKTTRYDSGYTSIHLITDIICASPSLTWSKSGPDDEYFGATALKGNTQELYRISLAIFH